MTESKAVTIRLDAADYARLEAAAQRRGVAPERLAEEYVGNGLNGQARFGSEPHPHERSTEPPRTRREAGLAALCDLAILRAHLPDTEPVDVVQLVREGRAELEQRGIP